MVRTFALAAIAMGLAACTPEVIKLPPKAAVAPTEPPRSKQPAPAPAQAFASAAPKLVFADPERRAKLASSFGAIDAMIEVEIRRLETPSIALGIVIDGELTYAKGFGVTDLDKKTKPDADTIYRIGSIGKSFTSLALLSLRDDGALGLDDPLTRWLPEAAGLVYPTRDQPPITLRQLVTNTSGLPGNGAFELGNNASEETVLKSLAGFALEDPPGTVWKYSNVGFVLAGLAVSRAARAPLREVARERIFAPLGMTSTAWDREALPEARIATGYDRGPGGKLVVPDQWRVGATAGAGGIYSSLRDMARYVALELSAYPPRNAPEDGPVRRSSIREAHATGFHRGLRVALANAPAKGEPLVHAEAATYGFGWMSAETCELGHLVQHGGGMPGFRAEVAFLPDHGVGVVTLVNGPGNPLDITKKALAILKRSGGLSERSPLPSPALDEAAKKLLGVYNAWDEAGYAAMLSAGRPKIPEEKGELAGYKELHGACKGFTPIEVRSPVEARFKLECERGDLEMMIHIAAADGGVLGFVGTTRDAAIPADVKRVVERVAGLVGKWDASVYPKHLAKSGRTLAETVTLFDGLRAEHDACSLKSASKEASDYTYALECRRGASVSLHLEVDPKDTSIVTRYAFQRGGQGTCPVR
jgi:CubicO group peptidase (beta-lactamase class C family)